MKRDRQERDVSSLVLPVDPSDPAQRNLRRRLIDYDRLKGTVFVRLEIGWPLSSQITEQP